MSFVVFVNFILFTFYGTLIDNYEVNNILMEANVNLFMFSTYDRQKTPFIY